jgi:hypothetical protein
LDIGERGKREKDEKGDWKNKLKHLTFNNQHLPIKDTRYKDTRYKQIKN